MTLTLCILSHLNLFFHLKMMSWWHWNIGQGEESQHKMCFTKGRVRRIWTWPPSICTSPPPLDNDPYDHEYLLLLVFQLKDIFYLLPGVASTCDGRFSVERISSINTDMYSDKQCNVLWNLTQFVPWFLLFVWPVFLTIYLI